MGEPYIGRVAGFAALHGGQTNFYPRYGGANDQVDRVLPIQPVRFQPIIPRYRLSTSETRDTGLGPAFIVDPWLARIVDIHA